MAEELVTLDLDEVLGQTKAVKVRRHGIEYDLADLNALSVHKIIQFQSLRRKATMLQLQENVSEEQAGVIEQMFDQMLRILCDSLPPNLSYSEKTAILAFYFTETAPKKVMSPNSPPLTGATSSQS